MNFINTVGSVPVRILNRITPYLPLKFHPVHTLTQLALSHEGFTTTVNVCNFITLLDPKSCHHCFYKFTGFNDDGEIESVQTINLGNKASAATDVTNLIGSPISGMGMIKIELYVDGVFDLQSRHLGRLTPQCYATFMSEGNTSVASVHSLAKFNLPALPKTQWLSRSIIPTDSIEKIQIYQTNPSPSSVVMQFLLFDKKSNPLANKEIIIPPKGTRCVTWSKIDFSNHEFVRIGSTGITGRNAKPTVLIRFKNSSWTAFHS